MNEVTMLKEIAVSKVAIALWNHVNVPRIVRRQQLGMRCYTNPKTELFDEVKFYPNELSIPKPIGKYINSHILDAMKEIESWVCYHSLKVFLNKSDSDFHYIHIYNLVWHSNGKINCKETARNLLNSFSLSEVEKFFMLCTYCLKDDIERMPPSLFSSDIVGIFDFTDRPLIYYWRCYLRNELNKIPVNEGVSIDEFMFKRAGVDNWSAKEYFFDRLTSDEQVDCAVWLITQHGMKYQKLILLKLNEAQRLRVYMDIAVEIVINCFNAIRGQDYSTVMTTWFEVRDVITQDQFVSIFRRLVPDKKKEEVLKIIWINSCDDFKHYLVNYCDGEIVKEIFDLRFRQWLENDLLFVMIRDLITLARENITSEEFFIEYCEKLISRYEFHILDRLLNSCFSGVRELVSFKQQLVQRDSVCDLCVDLIIIGNTSTLEKLLNLCFLEANESAKAAFKRSLSSKTYFETVCTRLIRNNELVKADLLINSCLVQEQERIAFKELVVKKPCLVEYFEELMMKEESDGLQKLNGILYWCLIEYNKISKFRLQLVTNSKLFKDKFLSFSSIEDFKRLDELLSKLLTSENLVLEYKKNTLMSIQGLKECVRLFHRRIDFLNEIILNCLPDPDTSAEFKKFIIFSPSVIEKLRILIKDPRFDLVKECVDWSEVSGQDRKLLKKDIIGDAIELARSYFSKQSGSIWKSVVVWWLEDEQSIREFKKTLPVDTIFNDLLKESIFSKYDSSGLLSYCRLRSRYGFSSLDQFLIWYFESPAAVKEYKLRRIDLYMNIDTITTLLNKKDTSYLEAIMKWFFQNDAREVAKFRLKNIGARILRAI